MALTKIQAAGLTADLIDETKLADNSIDSEHYNDGSIDNAHLADDAVGIAELSATGTASSSTFLRGDNSWVTPTDTNTTYTAGTGLNLSGTEFSVTSLALTTVQEAANQTAMLALTTQEGDVVVRTDENKSYVKNSGSAGNMNDFTLLRTPTDAVLSVNGNTGAISAAQISAAVGSAGVDFNDDVKARFGTGNDLELYHVGSGPYSVIRQNDGPLYIQTDDTTNGIQLGTYTDGETMAKFIKNGAVELYHDNVLRAQTTAHGFQAFGNLTIRDNVIFYIGDGNDLQIKHDSTTNNSSIANSTGQLNIAGADVRITNAAQTESQLIATENGAVELYHDNVKKAETYNQGLKCFNHCRIEGGEGESATLALYADQADDSDDQFMLASNGSMLTILGQYDSGWHRYLSVTPNGGVQLYYDQLDSGNPTPKFESTSTGAKVTGQLDIPDGSGSDGANHIRIGDSFDLRIYHDGTDSYVANVTNKLRLTSPEVRIENSGATEVMAKFIQNGACEFRYDDSVRLETTSFGATVTGDLTINASGLNNSSVSGQALQISGTTRPTLILRGNSDGTQVAEIQFADNSGTDDSNTGVRSGLIQYDHGSNFMAFRTNATEAMRIDSNGDVGIFAGSNPTAKLHVTNNASGHVSKFHHTNNGYDASIICQHGRALSSTEGTQISFRDDNGDERGKIINNTSTTTYVTSSDYRLKENQVAISDGINRVKQLKPYKFNWKNRSGITVDGFFAHEVENLVVDCVHGTKDRVVTKEDQDSGNYLDKNIGDEIHQMMDHSQLIPLLTAALKEAIAKIETLENKVAALEAG